MEYYYRGGAKEEDGISSLRAEIEDIRSSCRSTAQQTARLEAGMADLRSMYHDTHNQLQGLKHILHASDDDADTDSNDSPHQPFLLSRGSTSPRRPPTTHLPRSSAGHDEPAALSHLQQDVTGIGFQVENLVSKVDPLQDVVKLLNSEIHELGAKYAEAVDDIQKLKGTTFIGGGINLRVKMDLDEKIKKLEAEIKEMRANYSISNLIYGSFRNMKDKFTHKVNYLHQQFRLNVDALRLNCDRKYRRFCQRLDVLIHNLGLYEPFVQGALFGSAMGLLALFAYIRCHERAHPQQIQAVSKAREPQQIQAVSKAREPQQIQVVSKAREEGITSNLASVQADEGRKKLVAPQLQTCTKVETSPREAAKMVSSKLQDCPDKLESKPKEEGMGSMLSLSLGVIILIYLLI